MRDNTVSRRSFVTAAGAATLATAGAALAAGAASADESGYTYADTVAWDDEYDVVVIGLGFAGCASAIAAAKAGAHVLALEKAPDNGSGGNSRYCGQLFAWGAGDYDATLAYYKALTGGADVPEENIELIAKNVTNMGDFLAETYGLDSSEYCKWMDPEYPEFGSNVCMWTIHDGLGDSFFYQTVREKLDELSDTAEIWFESPAQHLIQDPMSKAVIGVQVDKAGEQHNVRALNGVVMACGGFECNREMMQNYTDFINYFPWGGLYNEGDGIRMAQEVEAKLWHMDAFEQSTSLISACYLGKDGERGLPFAGWDECSVGAWMIVGDGGARFADEAYLGRHGKYPTGNGLWCHPHYPNHSFAICDKTLMDAAVEAGQGIDESHADQLVECATVADAAAAVGCSEEALQQTIDDFNLYSEQGRDYEFGRDPASMRAFDGQAYYVIPVSHLLLNTQGGPQRNAECEVLGLDGEPIPHLYSAGELGGFTARMYQAGTNVAECHITGKVAGTNAAAEKDPLPAYEAAQPVA